ncbi:MAG: holo-ACP synthase [Thermoplasmatota archaeon]
MRGEVAGVGIDIVDVDNMEKLLSGRSRSRIFTSGELVYCDGKENPILHLSGRFAAKESVIKALSLSRDSGLILKDIEIVGGNGPPEVILRNELSKYNELFRIMISISHSERTAAAFAVAVEK